ncbi:MAG: Uncharacterized protein CEN91_595 [Candidatus Berkelbacteria bacterium Licking1014_85]|uniref:DUF4012 domain-containing protein n=1 Tax=Candidatus Berkelbacteria bacterium Licking1014_85 TaxID=2017148 RepID=A0A554LG40_9BACT|nr:MAG: Uncharacterized protein CEN91_595 [Candidatus Berkelbacteria bacterium Licking1014_85]
MLFDNIKPIKIKKTILKTPKDVWKNVKAKKRIKLNLKYFVFALVFFVSGVFIFLLFATKNFSQPLWLWRLLEDGQYVVIFQNNAELRSTGGLMGSFASFDIVNGKPVNWDFETNIYKKDKVFEKTTSQPMTDFFQKIWPGNRENFRDSNYKLGFDSAMETVSQYLNKIYDIQPKAIIAIDTTVATDLLKITGPIEMPKYQMTIDESNFLDVLQKHIQKDYFLDDLNKIENEPKTIIKDLFIEMQKRVNKKNAAKIFELVDKEIQYKHLLAYFKDQNKQKIAQQNNLTGEIKFNQNFDYIYINNTNAASNKSSLSILQTVKLEKTLQTRKNILTVNRKHEGEKFFDSEGKNTNYMRVGLPLGSKIDNLLFNNSAKEYKMTEEEGLTVVGIWFDTKALETDTLEIIYQLPENIDAEQIYWQKQPGTISDEIQISIDGSEVYNGQVDRDKLFNLSFPT